MDRIEKAGIAARELAVTSKIASKLRDKGITSAIWGCISIILSILAYQIGYLTYSAIVFTICGIALIVKGVILTNEAKRIANLLP